MSLLLWQKGHTLTPIIGPLQNLTQNIVDHEKGYEMDSISRIDKFETIQYLTHWLLTDLEEPWSLYHLWHHHFSH